MKTTETAILNTLVQAMNSAIVTFDTQITVIIPRGDIETRRLVAGVIFTRLHVPSDAVTEESMCRWSAPYAVSATTDRAEFEQRRAPGTPHANCWCND